MRKCQQTRDLIFFARDEKAAKILSSYLNILNNFKKHFKQKIKIYNNRKKEEIVNKNIVHD